ncbi:LLM class flavin-dependent oxidoreductase [Micromonospora wenchangensis]|uniref:LLM class flavin-dependent oxidoreductase n=1 Tax=Micromonospora wenchangensis TaxID=1185415 RepID=UPI003D73DDA2
MEYYVKLRDVRDVADLREKVRVWEGMGVSGVVVSDHLYTSRGSPSTAATQYRHDPFVLLGALGALSANLGLAALVANVGYGNPYLTVRHFAELARLFGGQRVYAGLGAGWNGEEFAALGMDMPPHRDRVERLAQSAAMARALFDSGIVTLDGGSLTLRQAPLSPSIDEPPRLAVGGGSFAVVRIAASYADHFDFDAPSHRLPLTRSLDGAATRARDLRRRMLTTFDDLVTVRRYLHEQLSAQGRAVDEVTTSLNISALQVRDNGLGNWFESLNQTYALKLDQGDAAEACESSPFFLLGSLAAIKEQLGRHAALLGLKFVVLPDSPDTECLLRHLT